MMNLLLPVLLAGLAQDAVDWKTDYDEAVNLSKTSGKPLHVYFTAKT